MHDNDFDNLRDDVIKLPKKTLVDILVHYAQCDSSIYYDLCLWTSQGENAIEAAQSELMYLPTSTEQNRHQVAEAAEVRISTCGYRVLFAAEHGPHDDETKRTIVNEVLKAMSYYEEHAYDEGWDFVCVADEAKKLLKRGESTQGF